jgi:hypothetical protein
MHAVVVTVTLQPGREQESADHLNANVIPRVKEAPGLVAGYWAHLSGARGSSMVIHETEEAARAAAEMVPAMVPDFVTLVSVEVGEVIAQV